MTGEQQTLRFFDDPAPPGYRPPRARRTDPTSSHEAADRLERSGQLSAQRRAALALVQAHPGCTSKELATRGDLDQYQIARRLPELDERFHLVEGWDAQGRRRRSKGCGELHWWPAGRSPWSEKA